MYCIEWFKKEDIFMSKMYVKKCIQMNFSQSMYMYNDCV